MPQTSRPLTTAPTHERDDAPVDLAVSVETPENIALSYQLAGPAARGGAYVLDLLVMSLVLLVLSVPLFWLAAYLPGTTAGLLLLLRFFFEWCYFVFSEGLFRGKTIGKAAFGLRVVHEQGHPLTFWGALLRNLLRVVDTPPLAVFFFATALTPPSFAAFLLVPGPALVAMVLSRHLQRIGDLAAGTVVISERHVSLPREPVIIARIQPLERGEINRWRPDSAMLSLIDDFLTRRHVLSHQRGHAICAELAAALGQKLEYRGDPFQLRDYPMSFLARVYVTFARRDEEDEIRVVSDDDSVGDDFLLAPVSPTVRPPRRQGFAPRDTGRRT
jgi:uncharacterized RDD family membrane protein YckC